MTPESSQTLLFCTAALLDQGRIVDGLSRPLTGVAFIAIMIWPIGIGREPAALVGVAAPVALAGLVEMYLAGRVAFDAALFRQLAGRPEGADFAGMDAALARLGLIGEITGDRPAEARIAGARRLLGLQVLALVAQAFFILAGAGFALTWL